MKTKAKSAMFNYNLKLWRVNPLASCLSNVSILTRQNLILDVTVHYVFRSIFLLGEGSVERMLTGKHYNNATRVLKYVYDAISRCRIDQFDSWLTQRGFDLQDFTSNDKFQTCFSAVSQIFLTGFSFVFDNAMKKGKMCRDKASSIMYQLIVSFSKNIY